MGVYRGAKALHNAKITAVCLGWHTAVLHTQHISHGDCRFFLGCRCYMGVGVQGEAGGEVAEDGGDRLDVHAVLQGNGGEGVAEIVEADFRDACSCQHSFQHVVHTVRGDRATCWTGEYIFAICLGFLRFKNFYRLR